MSAQKITVSSPSNAHSRNGFKAVSTNKSHGRISEKAMMLLIYEICQQKIEEWKLKTTGQQPGTRKCLLANLWCTYMNYRTLDLHTSYMSIQKKCLFVNTWGTYILCLLHELFIKGRNKYMYTDAYIHMWKHVSVFLFGHFLSYIQFPVSFKT